MRLTVCALLAFGVLGLCLAVPDQTVRWCTTSKPEHDKCNDMKSVLPVSCVRTNSYYECIQAIVDKRADAVTLDAGWVYEAGLAPNNLKPVVAEFHGSKDNPKTGYHAVAVVLKDSNFQWNQLQGRKSCHTGLGRSAGWNVPIGRLLCNLPEPRVPVENAVANFFSSSCVPCADRTKFPKLCQLCAGPEKCACNSHERFFGYSGALKCLQENVGDVAFVKYETILENLPEKADRDRYELLCPDNTRKPIDEYKDCSLAWIPSHAVVARSVDGKEDLIWDLLNKAQEQFGKDKSGTFQVFSSPHGKNLLFKDSAEGFLKVPSGMDAWLYLGYNYVSALRNLKEGKCHKHECSKVKWCAVSHRESNKCDEWSVISDGKVDCELAESTEDCIAKIVKGDADAMSLDGGFIYTAGKCGLVPVLAENYNSPRDINASFMSSSLQGYLAVAVVKTSNPGINWDTLRGKKSCHTGVSRTAGWNIPMGLIYNKTKSCAFDQFFSESCAPGSKHDSKLCALCAGPQPNQCAPNNKEKYYGYTGAFKCLVEKGDVAFVKDQTVKQNTGGKNPEYGTNLKEDDFELLCLDGSRKPVSQAASCHLAQVPNHAVVARKEKADCVRQLLLRQQTEFGRQGSQCSAGKFCLFHSETNDLLFRDDTKCLANLQDRTTYEKYLGQKYMTAVGNLAECSTSPLLEACTFHKK
ncbi:serotransferrin-like [Orycteropus afer afer]|uniref:Serotransferrin-like n=1 Tax=Orycteropus afer afer TaxID=1230840 RepID=A0AC54Z523_ORYAF|nr:serotransferrin-like [Orycteropus afer afer]